MSSPYSGRRLLLTEKQWRPSSIPAATRCSITTMVVAFSHTTVVGASLRSRMECRILQSRLPRVLCQPRYPPSISSAAPALDPVLGSEEEHLETSPTAAGEEANLSIGPPTAFGGGIENTIAD